MNRTKPKCMRRVPESINKQLENFTACALRPRIKLTINPANVIYRNHYEVGVDDVSRGVDLHGLRRRPNQMLRTVSLSRGPTLLLAVWRLWYRGLLLGRVQPHVVVQHAGVYASAGDVFVQD